MPLPRVTLLCMLALLVTACDTAERRAKEEALLNGSAPSSAEVPPSTAPLAPATAVGQSNEAVAPAVPGTGKSAHGDLAIPRDYRIRPLPEAADPALVTCRPDISAQDCAEGQAALARDADELIADGHRECERLNRFQSDASRALATGASTLDGIAAENDRSRYSDRAAVTGRNG